MRGSGEDVCTSSQLRLYVNYSPECSLSLDPSSCLIVVLIPKFRRASREFEGGDTTLLMIIVPRDTFPQNFAISLKKK